MLCGRCNNWTGIKYGTEYVKFVQALAEPADRAQAGEVVGVSLKTFPLRIVKQALTIIVSTDSSALTEENPRLREFVLSRDATGIPKGLRLFAFIPATRGLSKSTGTGVSVEWRNGETRVTKLAENSWWPLGWVLTFDNAQLEGAFELTDWGDRPFSRRETVSLHLPVRWTAGVGPADFRSPDQLARERTDIYFS